MPATILFDLDGTLVDTAPDLVATTNAVLAARSIEPVSYPVLRNMIGHGARAMLVTALEYRSVAASDEEVGAMHRAFLDHYEANIAVESAPFPRLDEALDALEAQGHRFAVCTNKYEALARRLLEALSLSQRFVRIVGPDTLGVAKPDPAHVLGAIRLAGGDAARAVMVGDSAADVDAAKAAGVPSVAVTFGYTATPAAELGASRVIDDYGELPGAVAALLA